MILCIDQASDILDQMVQEVVMKTLMSDLAAQWHNKLEVSGYKIV